MNPNTIFKLSPEAVYFDKGEGDIVTINLGDNFYKLDYLSKEIFLMAANSFTLEEVISISRESYQGDIDIKKEVINLLQQLIDKEILLIK